MSLIELKNGDVHEIAFKYPFEYVRLSRIAIGNENQIIKHGFDKVLVLKELVLTITFLSKGQIYDTRTYRMLEFHGSYQTNMIYEFGDFFKVPEQNVANLERHDFIDLVRFQFENRSDCPDLSLAIFYDRIPKID